MGKALNWLLAAPFIILVLVFAIANRQWIILSLDPISETPRYAINLPLWSLFFLGLLPGLIIGWIGCWFAQSKWRRSAKDSQRELKRVLANQPVIVAAPPPQQQVIITDYSR